MTLADKVTASRLVLAPVFLVVYLFPRFSSLFMPTSPATTQTLPPSNSVWIVVLLWVLFVTAELTDMFDGLIARKRKEVSDFGKFFDPFADTLTHLTLFFCFVLDGLLPPLLYLVIIYREFSILFIRNLMLKKGTAMGARMGGKIKTVTYVAACALALLASSIQRLGSGSELYQIFATAASLVFAISAIIAVVSFFDYLFVYKRAVASTDSTIDK